MKYIKAVLFVVCLFALVACTLTACTAPPTAAAAPAKAAEVVVPDQPQAEKEVVEASSVTTDSVELSAEVGCISYEVVEDSVLFNFCEIADNDVLLDSVYLPDGEPVAARTILLSMFSESVEVVIWPDDSLRKESVYLEKSNLTSAGATASNDTSQVLTDTASTEVTSTEVLSAAVAIIAEPVSVVAVVEGPVVGPCTQSWEENSDGTSVLELESGLGYFYLSMDNGDIWAEFPGEPTLSVHYVVSTHENKGAIAELHGATSVKVVVPMGTHRPDGTLCTYASPVSRTYLARELAAKTSPSGTRAVHLVFRPDGGVEVR